MTYSFMNVLKIVSRYVFHSKMSTRIPDQLGQVSMSVQPRLFKVSYLSHTCTHQISQLNVHVSQPFASGEPSPVLVIGPEDSGEVFR
jgi:hypothetical protein